MSWVAVGSVAVSAVSSKMGADASKKGAAASAALQREQMALTKEQYEQGREDLSPYREAGARGLSQYEDMLNQDNLTKWGGFSIEDMQEDPGYQFRMEQGYQGLDRMSAAGGERFSGKRGIALQDYGQRMASQEFGAARQRSIQDYSMQRSEGLFRLSQFANLAASGQSAAGASSNLGMNYAGAMAGMSQNIGATMQQGANARAAGYMGVGNAVNSGLAAYQYQQNFKGYGGGGYDDGNDYDPL